MSVIESDMRYPGLPSASITVLQQAKARRELQIELRHIDSALAMTERERNRLLFIKAQILEALKVNP